jgi:hypothetical protein
MMKVGVYKYPALPELTAVGGKRAHTLDNSKNIQPSYGSGPFVNHMLHFTPGLIL